MWKKMHKTNTTKDSKKTIIGDIAIQVLLRRRVSYDEWQNKIDNVYKSMINLSRKYLGQEATPKEGVRYLRYV